MRRVSAALTALVCTVMAGGCAVVPDGGRMTSATIAAKGGQQNVFVQLIPPPPQPGWSPDLIVSGFLLASASFAGDHVIARKYLTPKAARSWHPGSSVTEFADTPTPTTTAVRQNMVTFQVKGKKLGTISANGQFKAAEPGTSPVGGSFKVIRVAGKWRIASAPHQLLLSRRDVDRAFRARDLYFFDPSISVLVPDPVYVPAESTSADLVTHLVAALWQGPQGWLAGGTRTAFPPGTRVLGTSVDGSTAIVNLGGRAAMAGPQQREQMATQLLQTLASVGPAPSVQSVVFEINGKPLRVSCATGEPPALRLSQCQGPVQPRSGSRVYYIDGKGRVATLSGFRSDTPVRGAAGTGELPFDQIAVSPDERSVAGVSGGVLYTGRLDGSLSQRLTASRLTTLSWDSAGGLWVAGRSGNRTRVWRLDRGMRPIDVRLPQMPGPVTAMRVAPDGVRVAIITGSGAASRLWLAAIDQSRAALGEPVPIGTDISAFSGLTWYDIGNVIVLSKPASGPVLYEVPVDGRQSRQIATDAGAVSISATQGGKLLVTRDDGTIMQLPNPAGSIWRPAGARGRSPVYPG